ncbi:MAG: acetyl-CoA carboxylase biotin carboxylase subunit [Sphingomonadales bacterium]
MFSKIIIANRGEIACRVIRTARRMGIATVAVYSEADRGALHAEMADEAVEIGPAPAAQSYLAIDKIVEAARKTGAQAMHPGYGFLAENADFARALEKENITFIGPPLNAIAIMGDKVKSKKLAQEGGVNTIPGHIGIINGPDEAVRIAREIGYPVMIKAAAGGGGKGMRVARDDDEVREGFRSAANEARSSFGDDRIFIEKFITEPRHIEIQVLADRHGNVIHLGERECSIQRRHQKVIEEAPSPFLDAKTRAAMAAQAVALSRKVDYYSAGTVEFIVDADRNFYFLEMNTRLQVEHPVTELITGLDLVELMIRVAAGEPLPLDQGEVDFHGWAIESRIYAEDPRRGFLPSIGRVARFQPAPLGEKVRLDSGIVEGSEISMHYDPLIAKLCTHGKTRAEAVDAMRAALDRTYIRGVEHNIQFLSAVMAHNRFQEGRLSTNFIDDEYGGGFDGSDPDGAARDALIATAALMRLLDVERGGDRRVLSDRVISMDGRAYPVTVSLADGGCDVVINGRKITVHSDWLPGQRVFCGTVDGRDFSAQIDRVSGGYRIGHGGSSVEILVLSPREAALAAFMPEKKQFDSTNLLLCPMPGLVVAIEVAEGDVVKAGQPLAVVEAMKMENILRAERDGTVLKIRAQAGDSLAIDQVIMEFDLSDGGAE